MSDDKVCTNCKAQAQESRLDKHEERINKLEQKEIKSFTNMEHLEEKVAEISKTLKELSHRLLILTGASTILTPIMVGVVLYFIRN